MFAANPRLRVYRNRILLVALCQGAAKHFIDGKTGVKDLDVYTFYAEKPDTMMTPLRHVAVDFGESEFGYRPKDEPVKGERFVGRRVDLLQRSLKVSPRTDPVKAVRDWLQTSRATTPKLLREKAVVGIWPDEYLGQIIWPESQ